jgi:hypothetical protein
MAVLKKVVLVWMVIICLRLCAFSQEDSEDVEKGLSPSVAGVIEKYIRASGGPAVAEIRAEIREGTLLRGVSGKVPLETAAKAPGKWRYGQTFAWGEQVCFGCDGAIAWVQDTKAVSPMTSRQRLDLELLLDVQVPLKIRRIFPEMTIKGAEKSGHREAVVIAAASQDGLETELAFDKETGLLVRAGEMVFEDYRDVGRVKRPFRILLGRDEGEKHLRMKMQFSETRHDLEVDDARFERPVCVLLPKDPPLYKRRTRVDVSVEALDRCLGTYRHPERPEVIYTVTRQQNHLMLGRTDWSGQRLEIIPESENDYFIEFLNQEFHFVKDASGRVTHLEIKADRTLKAEKIEEES